MSSSTLVTTSADAIATDFRDAWVGMLRSSGDPFRIYQSPEWYELVRSGCHTEYESATLVVNQDPERGLAGIVPLYSKEQSIDLPIAMGYTYRMRPKRLIQVPSGNLMLPAGESWFDRLFDRLGELRPAAEAIEMSRVPVGGPLDHYLRSSPRVRREYCLFEVPGLSRIDTIPLPSSYEEFLRSYSSKKRYNIRRQLRQLQERAGGGLRLRSFRQPGEAPEFFDFWDRLGLARGDSAPLSADRDRHERRFRRMAELGLLYSYVLMDGERPIAAWSAIRWHDLLMLETTLHDPEYNAQSPGTCLLHMVAEQLIQDRAATLINLGYGCPIYKSQATNVALDYVGYWLIPRDWRSHLFELGYNQLRRGIALAKTHLKRSRSPADVDPAGKE